MEILFDTIKYKEHLILHAGTITVSGKCITAVAGESGSGKTSLFKAIENQPGTNVRIASCPQEPLFLDRLTIGNHFSLLKDIYQKNDEIENDIQSLQLENVLDKIPAQLSGGENKRAAFLLTCFQEADIYMFDEPTASVNSEYREAYLSIMKKLLNKGKSIILFTHDKELFEIAEFQYQIHQHELKQIKSVSKTEKLSLSKDTDLSLLQTPSYFFKMKKSQKKYLKVIETIIIICTVLIGIGYSYSNIVYHSQQAIVKQMQSDELIVYKPWPIDDTYTYGAETPLNEEDIQKINSVSHVKETSWRYDFDEYDRLLDYDITEEHIFNESSYTVGIYKNDSFFMSFEPDMSNGMLVCTYMKDNKSFSEIEVDFGGEGIYISRFFANGLKRNIGIKNDEELQNYSLRFEISVPTYTTYGRWKCAGGDDTEIYNRYSPTVESDELYLPISGILKWSSFGLQNTGANAVFVERSNIEPLIEKHKKDRERTIYVFNEDCTDFSIDILPENNKEVLYIFEDKPWTPSSVSVFVDQIECVPDVVEDLKDMGYAINSAYTQQAPVFGGAKAIREAFLTGSLLLAAITILLGCGLQIMQQKAERNTDCYFRHIGLSSLEIRNVRKQFYIENTKRKMLAVCVVSGISFLLLSILVRYPLLPSVTALFLIAVTVFTIYCIVPIISDRYRKC